MAKITRGTGSDIPIDSAQLSIGAATSSASGGAAIGQAYQKYGTGVEALASTEPTPQYSSAIINQHLANLTQIKSSIDSSMYASKMNDATVALNQAFSNRSQKTYDENGNPTFTSLPQDVGQIGQNILNQVSQTITDPLVKQRFLESFQGSIGDAQIRSLSVAKGQQQDYASATYNQFKQINTSQANVDDISMLPTYVSKMQEVLAGQVAGGMISASDAQKEITNFDTSIKVNHATQAINSDPVGSLQKLQQNPDSYGLPPEQINNLLHSANGAVSVQRAQQEATKQSIINNYGDLFTQAQSLQSQGKPVPPNLLSTIQKISAGTLLANPVNKMVAQQDYITQFSTLNPTQRQAALTQLDKTDITDPNLAGLSTTLKEVDKNLNSQMTADPVQYMVDRNIISKSQPLDFSQQSDTLAEQIKNKQAQASLVSSFTGMESSGLTASETNQVNRYISGLSPLQQASQLGSLMSSLGQKQYTNLLTDIKLKDTNSLLPAIGADMADGHADFAQQVLNGQQAITDKTALIPKQDKLIKAILPKLPNYNNEQQKSDTINKIINAYASVSKDSEFIDSDQLNGIIKQATNGNVINYNGVSVEPYQYGQSESQFKQGITSINIGQVSQLGGISNSKTDPTNLIQNAYLQNVGRGVYTVHPKDPNEPSVLLDQKGQIFLLDMNKLSSGQSALSYDVFANSDRPTKLLDNVYNKSLQSPSQKAIDTGPKQDTRIQPKTPIKGDTFLNID